jgi:FkbM family methyltransferase
MDQNPRRLETTNERLKRLAKMLLQNNDLVFFLKAIKIAVDASIMPNTLGGDKIFSLLPAIIGRPNPVILDVGANMGQFAARIARQFPDGQVYSFEPVRANVTGLYRVQRWLHLKNVRVFQEALCDSVGSELIHIPVFKGGYPDGALAVLERSRRSYDNVSYHAELVRTNTIDDFVEAHKFRRVDFIKVDTEGAEDRVVGGGMHSIGRFTPTLYLETPFDQSWLDCLYEKGYRAFYNDGLKLWAPSKGESQTNVLLVHPCNLNQISALF